MLCKVFSSAAVASAATLFLQEAEDLHIGLSPWSELAILQQWFLIRLSLHVVVWVFWETKRPSTFNVSSVDSLKRTLILNMKTGRPSIFHS